MQHFCYNLKTFFLFFLNVSIFQTIVAIQSVAVALDIRGITALQMIYHPCLLFLPNIKRNK